MFTGKTEVLREVSAVSKTITEWIDQNQAEVIAASDAVWCRAETAMREKESAAVLADLLEKHGFAVERGVAGMPTAFTAAYGASKPVVAILGEYDALPGLSQRAEPQAAPVTPGAPGHGCGHNLLGAAALGAAIAVKAAIDAGEVSGTVRYYGCPAEETGVGKIFMVREGLFNDVDIALTWHPGGVNYVKLASNQAVNSVKFRFFGRTAHAAGDPWNGRSALDAVELLNIGANYLREHIIPEARIHYVITNGGLAPNIVPATAEVWYFVRAPQRFQVEDIYARLQKIAAGAAMMTETTWEVEFLSGVYNTLANETVGGVMHAQLLAVGAPPFTDEDKEFAAAMTRSVTAKEKKQTLMRYGEEIASALSQHNLCETIVPPYGLGTTMSGSSDVADVSWVTPTGELNVACYPLGVPGHSWQVAASSGAGVGHRGMLTAAKVLGLAAAEFMRRPELVAAAQAELGRKTAANPYASPLPAELPPPVVQE